MDVLRLRGARDSVMVLDKSVGMHPHPRGAQLDFLRTHSEKSR